MQTPRAYPGRGFTLIELLTVIAIVGILAAIIIPTVGAVRQSARNSVCQSNLRQLALAAQLYASDHKGKMHPLAENNVGWTHFLEPYLVKDNDAWHKGAVTNCPAKTTDTPGIGSYGWNIYRYWGPWNHKIDASPAPSSTILVGDMTEVLNQFTIEQNGSNGAEKPEATRHGTGQANFAMIDGSVRSLNPTTELSVKNLDPKNLWFWW